MMYDSTQDTLAHIRRVQTLLADTQGKLTQRAIVHDVSKTQPPEKEAFDAETPKLRDLTYGSDEYKAALARLGKALEHHYADNSHHPEHWPNGIRDMSLLDVLEMTCDWVAAVERHADGDVWKSIDHNQQRFGMDDQLTQIIRNTVHEMGWGRDDSKEHPER